MSAAPQHERQWEADTPKRPALRLVEGFRSAAKLSRRGVWTALSLLGVAFAIQLWLTNVIIEDAYRADALTDQQIELDREHTAALEKSSAQNSPQHLAERATDLGMVPAGSDSFLDLANQTVIDGDTAAPPADKIDPNLVPNAILNPPAEEPEDGASAVEPSAPAVPSEFEMSSPSTR